MTTNIENTTSGLENRELERQGTWIKKGVDRYKQQIQKNEKKGRNSVTPPFIYVQKQLLVPLAEKIDSFVKRELSTAGRRHTAALPLRDLDDSKKIALITLKLIIDCIASKKTLAQTAQQIGSMIELELQNNIFKEKEPHLHTVVLRDLIKRTNNEDSSLPSSITLVVKNPTYNCVYATRVIKDASYTRNCRCIWTTIYCLVVCSIRRTWCWNRITGGRSNYVY